MMFGQTNKPAFGGASFGSQNGGSVFSSKNIFASQTSANNAGGLFSANTAQTGGVFGAATSNFGQNTMNSAFGSQQQAGKGSLFSSNGQPSSNLFSTPASTGFGAKTPAPAAFSSAVQNAATFGTPATTSISLFGSSNPGASNSGSTLFGPVNTQSAFTQQSGTVIKFNPPSGQDSVMKGSVSTSISTRHQCIIAMKEYESKSLEELRIEDYLANRKGPQVGSTGLYVTPQATQAQTPFSFDAQKNTGFGGFSQTTAAGGTSLFSQPQQVQSVGLFGSATNKTAFGAVSTTSTAGFGGFGGGSSVFGQSANKTLLSQPVVTQNGSIFGSTQAASPALGAFGSKQSGFGNNTQSVGLFGNKTTSFAAQPVSSVGLTFGQPSTLSSANLFASKPAAQPTTGANFGQTSTAGFGGLFANKPTGFGAVNNTLGTTGFGQPGTSLGSGLGAGLTAGVQSKPILGCFGTGFGNTTGFNLGNTGLTQNTANNTLMSLQAVGLQNPSDEVMNQLKKTLVYSPYGDSPLFRNLENSPLSREDLLKPTNPVAQKAALTSQSQYKVSPRPTARIKPKVLNALLKDKSDLFDGLEEDDLSFGNVTFVPRRNVKKLTINRNNSFTKPNSWMKTPEQDTSQSELSQEKTEVKEKERQQTPSTLNRKNSPVVDFLPPANAALLSVGLFQNISDSFLNDTISDFNHQTPNGDDSKSIHSEEEPSAQLHPAGIVLHRHGYYTIPALEQLATMVDENGDCIIEDFVIGREGYGNVMFPGLTNIRNLNLDEIVHFRRKEITVYPSDEQKPPVGCGLNKKAQVTLHSVWPSDEKTREYIKDAECLAELHYQEKLERITAKIGANYLDYRPETGSWVFEVRHFSKYGLLDEEDDDDPINMDPKKLVQLKEQQQQQLAIQKQQIKVAPVPLLSAQEQKTKSYEADNHEELEIPKIIHTYLHPLLTDDDLHNNMKEHNFHENFDINETESPERPPASHQLASHLGVMAEDLQLRKASFFGTDDFTPMQKEDKRLPWHVAMSVSNIKQPKTFSKYRNPQEPVLQLLDQRPELLVLEPVQLPVTRMAKTKTCIKRNLRQKIAALSQSLFAGKQDLVMDLGLFQGKLFRVGWGPQWSFVHGGQLLTNVECNVDPDNDYDKSSLCGSVQKKMYTEKSRLHSDAQQLLVEKLGVSYLEQTSQYKAGFLQAVIENLMIQLQHTQISAECGCPQATPSIGNGILKPLMKCAQDALGNLGSSPENHLLRQSVLVWELCETLWGDLDDTFLEGMTSDSYAYHIARREALSSWLKNAVSGTVQEETELIKAKLGSEASIIFQHLTGHQLREACDIAQQSGNHQVALLIAQASRSEDICNYICHQLMMWEESEMDQFIQTDMLKIYALLAGKLTWTTSTNQTINICEDLDWKRALGIHLWFLCRPTSTVHEAISYYSNSVSSKSGHSYVAPPLPSYMEVGMESQAKQDVCYQLIWLFCDRSYPLHKLLNPTSAVSSDLDYRLSWQLSQVLQALGYTNVSDYHSAMLCTSFASQLENMGLWFWAVFVLIHLSDHKSRKHALLQLLLRHISLHPNEEEQEQEQFLHSALKIPLQWMHQAKAVKAGYYKHKEEEAWHWLMAENWNKAHDLILNCLASKAIVNENFTDLKCLLNQLGSPEVSCTVENWDNGGRVFLDYITMMETLQQLQQGEPSFIELEKLQSDVYQLSRCITELKCISATDRLCQSEMAKRAANLMRTLLLMKTKGNDINEMLVTETTDLPLPEDYALQELHQLTRCYMISVTMS